MALNDRALLKPTTARFYTAEPGTERPTDVRNPGAAWKDMGHTSLEDIVAVTTEGGETSIVGTLQNKQARTDTTPPVDAFTMNLHQFDDDGLKLYYGANAVVDGDDVDVPAEPVPTEAAWLVVFYDGNYNAGIYARKTSIFRNDSLAISDTESLAQLPLRVSPLSEDGQSPYRVIKPHLYDAVTP